MKTKIISVVVILIVILVGAFFYFTRPVSAPSENIENAVVALSANTSPTAKQLSIIPEKSNAQFSLNEMLYGKPKLVIGTTNQVVGEINIDTAVNAKSPLTIGEVKINARTLKTDSEQRNGALGRLILKSEDDANEFITFKPTKLDGVPDTLTIDKTFSFVITGDMTVSGVTKSEAFDATGTLNADGSFTADASTSLAYADFGLMVPNFSFLANVDKIVRLEVKIFAK